MSSFDQDCNSLHLRHLIMYSICKNTKMKRKSFGDWSEVLKMFWNFNLHEKYSLENKSTNNMNDNIFFAEHCLVNVYLNILNFRIFILIY